MSAPPHLSIVLATHNRREVVGHTLDRVAECGLAQRDYEVIVVDNASSDGTADALRGRGGVRVLALRENLGSCAKALGVPRARGAVVLFLDDDSHPRPGCLDRMLLRFETDSTLGAAGFTVHLPDRSQECSALPHVFVGCGVGLRAAALRQVGGLDASFFMQAEEYDLSFRLLQGGWRVETFADLQVEHLKSPQARRSERTTYFDVRNNLRVLARYLPSPFADIYRADWLQRYRWMAEQAGHTRAYWRGVSAGRRRALLERWRHRHLRLDPEVLEQVFSWSKVRRRMLRLAEQGMRRIVLVDLGKNVHAFVRGAAAGGLNVLAIADDRLAAPGRRYRRVPVMTTEQALTLHPDAWVVSNTSYVHAARRWATLGKRTSRPVFNWFDPPVQLAVPTLQKSEVRS